MRALLPLVLCLVAFVGQAYRNHSRASEAVAGQVEAYRGKTMGSTFAVTWRASERHPELPAEVDDILERINRLMSTYDPKSELSQFNQAPSTEWFAVSAETAEVISIAREVSELSEGAFDVTVKPLVAAWGFGAGAADSRPTAETLEALASRVGFEKLEVRMDPPALRKTAPELQVDLSAIAPGYAVDKIVELLEQAGVRDYLVDVGGELRLAGEKAPGKSWRVAIETPDSPEPKPEVMFEPGTTALATSGDYRNYYVLDGRRVSHTIDPRTRRPIEHNLASVTVLAPTGASADALATALSVLGPIKGLELAARTGASVFMLVRNSDGSFERRATGLFESLPKR